MPTETTEYPAVVALSPDDAEYVANLLDAHADAFGDPTDADDRARRLAAAIRGAIPAVAS